MDAVLSVLPFEGWLFMGRTGNRKLGVLPVSRINDEFGPLTTSYNHETCLYRNVQHY